MKCYDNITEEDSLSHGTGACAFLTDNLSISNGVFYVKAQKKINKHIRDFDRESERNMRL